MDRYKETFETWNKIASIYQDKFMNMDLYNETYDVICNAITQPKAKILEIGCGPGNITNYLLSKRPDFEILGTDIAPNMIELAKKNNPKASFIIMDCRQIDQLKRTYNGIVGGFCLPYLSDLDAAKLVADCSNLLSENGLFYLSFVEGNPDKSDYQVNSSGDRVYFHFYQLDSIKKLLTDNNFVSIKVFYIEYKKSETEKDIHTVLIAKKTSTT